MVKRSIAPDSRDVARLRHRFQGQILLPEEGAYHQARQVWNAMVDRRPAIITRCASPADVAAAVGFARARDLEIGVRCGGHSVLGLSVPEAGLMIDLSLLRSVRVDPDRRRAWVAGGACSVTSIGPPSRSGWPPRPATSPTPAWVASPSAAGWGGWRGGSGLPATTSPGSRW